MDQPMPVVVEVSRGARTEGERGVLYIRVTNLSGEQLTCTLGISGDLTGAWRDAPTLMAPGASAKRPINTNPLPRGSYIAHLSAEIQPTLGPPFTLVGHFDRYISALESGPASVNVNVHAGDASAVDASSMSINLGDREPSNRWDVMYESIELVRSSSAVGPDAALLIGGNGARLRVVTGDRVVVGRDAERADIVASSMAVSRVHAELRRDRAGYTLGHISSTNETVLNAKRVFEERPMTLPLARTSSLELGGSAGWRCRVHPLAPSSIVEPVRRGLSERGRVPGPDFGRDDTPPGLLLVPDDDGGDSTPVLWLESVVRVAEIGVFDGVSPRLVLAMVEGLHEIDLDDDGRVCSVGVLQNGAHADAGHLSVIVSA